MEFFDQKEEVIDVQLTQFGKHLLSKGRFKPEYYAFLTMMCFTIRDMQETPKSHKII